MYNYTNDMFPSVMHELYKKFIHMALAIKIYSGLIEVNKD